MRLLIVNYHYIRDEHSNRGIYPLTLSGFESQVEAISKRYRFVGQTDVVDLVRNPDKAKRHDNLCLLTFDDGLREQMVAFELLFQKGIQPLFCVPISVLENRVALGVHKLHYVLQQLSTEEIHDYLQDEHGVSASDTDDEASRKQYRYDDELTRKVKYLINFVLNEEQRDSLVNGLFGQLVADERGFADRLYLSVEDTQKLARHDSLGSHGSTHRPLGTLTTEQIKLDILQSTIGLERITGKRIRSISYPFGGPIAVTKQVAEIARTCGLTFGLTMTRGVNGYEELSRPLLLKRVDTNDAPGGKAARPEYNEK